ncbi:MAG: CDP-alcohol phosphatidyltransferase family protein [Thermodesulfobacteriota bacterium]
MTALCAGSATIAGGYALLRMVWHPDHAGPWGRAAALMLIVLGWRVWIAFRKYPGGLPGTRFPGLANRFTFLRGLMICALAGFLGVQPPEGPLAWLPLSLYGSVLILDVFDGFLARLRNETSLFGAFLDRDMDALATLTAILLAVHYGRLPPWFVVAGIAYYVFILGQWWRQKRGRPLNPLPESKGRKYAAALQSAFIWLSLFPGGTIGESDIPAALVMIPVLAGFVRDWRAVSASSGPGLPSGPFPGAWTRKRPD